MLPFPFQSQFGGANLAIARLEKKAKDPVVKRGVHLISLWAVGQLEEGLGTALESLTEALF